MRGNREQGTDSSTPEAVIIPPSPAADFERPPFNQSTPRRCQLRKRKSNTNHKQAINHPRSADFSFTYKPDPALARTYLWEKYGLGQQRGSDLGQEQQGISPHRHSLDNDSGFNSDSDSDNSQLTCNPSHRFPNHPGHNHLGINPGYNNTGSSDEESRGPAKEFTNDSSDAPQRLVTSVLLKSDVSARDANRTIPSQRHYSYISSEFRGCDFVKL